MFSLFKKKEPIVSSPASGKLMPLSEVSDPVFSQGMMGPGFAVEPESNDVFSPITGTVVSIFPTKHAIGLKREDGKEVLVHLGIDTVELNGQGFEVFVNEADKVTAKTKIASMDCSFLKEQGKESTIMVLFPNDSEVYSINTKAVDAGEEISVN